MLDIGCKVIGMFGCIGVLCWVLKVIDLDIVYVCLCMLVWMGCWVICGFMCKLYFVMIVYGFNLFGCYSVVMLCGEWVIVVL